MRFTWTRARAHATTSADEELRPDPDAALLILTGFDKEQKGGLARQGRDVLQVPVFAVSPEDSLPPALRPGFDEVLWLDERALRLEVAGVRARPLCGQHSTPWKCAASSVSSRSLPCTRLSW